MSLSLRSNRVVIDQLTMDDATALAANRNDPAVARFQGFALPYTIEDATRLVAAGDGPLPPTAADGAVQLAVRLPGSIPALTRTINPSELRKSKSPWK